MTGPRLGAVATALTALALYGLQQTWYRAGWWPFLLVVAILVAWVASMAVALALYEERPRD